MPIGLSNSWEDALFSSLEQISVAMYNEAAWEGLSYKVANVKLSGVF